jgi:hypothetical protein
MLQAGHSQVTAVAHCSGRFPTVPEAPARRAAHTGQERTFPDSKAAPKTARCTVRWTLFPGSGKVTPVTDRLYSLSEAPAASRYLETGHAHGKLIINLE